ncbi:MAG: FAD-dependent oxidoreductase [Gammaproteobacteria bacterium]|nr:FAD-dependent oxidoreductase [Gammaproteobacteria bacterium]
MGDKRDLVVIGAGAAGLVATYTAAAAGARVTLVERHRMGGDCLNTGCVPSKALLHAARISHEVRTAGRVGVHAGEPRVDFAAVMAHVRRAISAIEPNDSAERYTQLGAEVIRGQARLVDAHTLEVDGGRLATRSLVLATGAEPVMPALPGLGAAHWVTSDSVWSLTELPRRLVVLGGGAVGCELAQAFARLGSAVTLVELAERLLPREIPVAGELLAAAFAAEGLQLFTGWRARQVEHGRDGAVLVVADAQGSERRLPFDVLLLALGRQPRTGEMGLEMAAVARDARGFIRTDARLRTSVRNIYACGDITGHQQFTHVAGQQGWCAAMNALFRPLARFRWAAGPVPRVTYTDPEIASVEAAGVSITPDLETVVVPLSEVDRAVVEGRTRGFAALRVDRRGRLRSATLAAPGAGELLAELTLAMRHGLRLADVLATIHAYPTYAEINRRAAAQWRQRHLSGSIKPLARAVLGLLRGV